MQNVYYLRHVPSNADANRIRLLRDVRTAMRHLNPQATADDAEDCIDAVRASGYGILGAQEGTEGEGLATLEVLNGILTDSGCEVVRNLDTERADQRWHERRAAAEGMTPEQVFAGDPLPSQEVPDNVKRIPVKRSTDPATDTMAALLVPCDGNPLQAAALAINLRRINDNQRDFWNEVIACYLRVFPWVEEPLRHGGVL
jgi:hypothetical protein